MKYFSLEAFISEPTGYRLMQLYQSSDTSILETALSEIKTNNKVKKTSKRTNKNLAQNKEIKI